MNYWCMIMVMSLTSNGYDVSTVTVDPSSRVAFTGISSVTAAPFVAVAITTWEISFGHPAQCAGNVNMRVERCHAGLQSDIAVTHLD